MIGGAPVDLSENSNIEQVMEDKLELAEKTEEKINEVKPEIKVDEIVPLPALPEIEEKTHVETEETKPNEEKRKEN